MYDLNEGEILVRNHFFEVVRDDNTIPIKIWEVLSGGELGKCIAVPEKPFHDTEDGLLGEGQTVEASLSECLRKIKELPLDKIFRVREFKNVEIPATLRFRPAGTKGEGT